MKFEQVQKILAQVTAEEGLIKIASSFTRVKFATSLGEEDQVITHLIASRNLPISIFTLDTGRLFQETYDLIAMTRSALGVSIEVLFPQQSDVENFVNSKGINGFYDSIESRKECCHIRKVKSLQRALTNAEVWVTGLRKSQSANRQQMDMVEWNEEYNVINFNPLINWTDKELHQYIADNNVPVNPLHKKGFASIGCAPCTRAIAEGEDPRAGRWWWEGSAKECGLHQTKAV